MFELPKNKPVYDYYTLVIKGKHFDPDIKEKIDKCLIANNNKRELMKLMNTGSTIYSQVGKGFCECVYHVCYLNQHITRVVFKDMK